MNWFSYSISDDPSQPDIRTGYVQAVDILQAVAKIQDTRANVYPHQFTVRAGTRRGGPSELQKIVNGYGDWMFYGHANPAGALASWYLRDLRSFRAGLIRHSNGGPKVRWGDQRNADGTPFSWFDVRSFPEDPKLIVASSAVAA